MKCSFDKNQIINMIESEISQETKNKIMEHIKVCEECKKFYTSILVTKEFYEEDSLTTNQSILYSITEGIEKDLYRKNKVKRSFLSLPYQYPQAIKVAGFLTVLCLSIFIGFSHGEIIKDKIASSSIYQLLLGNELNQEEDIKEDHINDNINKLNVVDEYKLFLSQISDKEIESSSIALEKCISYTGNDKVLNDELFNQYLNLYNKIIQNQDDSNERRFEENSTLLNENGFIEYNTIGGGWSIIEKPNFLVSSFSGLVTDVLKDYLIIDDKMRNEPTNIDGYKAVSWNELSNRIIICEQYLTKYQDYQYATIVQRYINSYLKQYTTASGMMLQFLYEDGKLNEEAKNSYEDFIENYPNSKYYKLIKDYYNVLKSNNFRLNSEAKQILMENGIDVTWFEAGV